MVYQRIVIIIMNYELNKYVRTGKDKTLRWRWRERQTH